MASDVLPLMLTIFEDDNMEIPSPSDMNDLEMEAGEFATLVSCDTTAYRRFMDNRSAAMAPAIP